MKMNHMNLVVPNVAETAVFFERHFDFKIQKTMGEIISILHGDDDFVLILSNFPNTVTFEYPADFHLGFYQENQEKVFEVFEKLKLDGVELPQQPKKIRDRFGFYFHAPGNILIEITCPSL
jgi:catechol 2,3-dioxygenase-like lactoylglutathione lyase family enzyme